MNIDKIADAIHRAKRDCDNNVALDYRCLAQAAADAVQPEVNDLIIAAWKQGFAEGLRIV